MGADAVFRIGSTHEICQDYGISGLCQPNPSYPGIPYVIVSDGCSGGVVSEPGSPPPPKESKEPGAPFTDFGSRFLVRAAQLHLPDALFGPSTELLFDELKVISLAAEMATKCRFRASALDATLLAAVRDDRAVKVFQCGDGVVAARNRETQQISYVDIDFDNNAPFYPSYLLSPTSMGKYLTKCKSVTTTVGVKQEDGSWSTTAVETPLTKQSQCARVHHFGPEYDLVMVMTDGAKSFQDFGAQAVPLTEVLEQLFAIKNTEGEFITRRCNRFLGSFCKEKGWKHNDDISVGAIYVP